MTGGRGGMIGAGLLLILSVALGYGAYQHGRTTANTEWQARWAEQGEFQAKARAAAETSYRAEERRRQTAINQVESNAREQNKNAATDAASADALGERLHVAADDLAARSGKCTDDTDTAERGKAATRAAMVLSDLLKRSDSRAGDLAQAYDRARIAGLACEQAYAAVSGASK
jgi:hypothetical protein